MGRRGPKSQPTVLKLERGNPGKRAINHDEPELATLIVKAPKGMKGRALTEWKRLAGELTTKGVLTIGDLVTFETYCNLVGEVDAYEKLVRRVKHADAHRLGYAGYLLKLRGQMKQYAAELGLTPSSRSGVKRVKTEDPKDARKKRFFGGTAAASSEAVNG